MEHIQENPTKLHFGNYRLAKDFFIRKGLL